jgi:phosphoglycolate phosphatase-like HAD superfamily hydrolase
MNKPVIALDADGVLLDYNLAYARAWKRAFGTHPQERDPQAYWAFDRWSVELLEGERLTHFSSCFDEEFWCSVPPIAGALEACFALNDAGHTLVCVSALDERYANARLRNLREAGFPIEIVVATGRAPAHHSPKARAISALRPAAFVDDYLPYFVGIDPAVHTALVTRQPNGSPNTGDDLSAAKSSHVDLRGFAQWWLDGNA